jgi:hypothetical protein
MVRDDFPDDDVERWMTGFDQAVAKVDKMGDDYPMRGAVLDDALVAVLAVKLLSIVDPSASWVGHDLRPFFDHVRHVLRQHRRELHAVMAKLDLALWERTADGWYKACMKRSAAQVIAEDVDRDDERPLIEPGPLNEVDTEMREIGPGLPPLPPEVVPKGLPASHWWWFLPKGPPEDVVY